MGKVNFCKFGKEIKKKLVDIDKSQEWLISQVAINTGLYFDRSYLSKIMRGTYLNPTMVNAICEILDIKQS